MKTKEEITEFNKMCAEFLGYTNIIIGTHYDKRRFPTGWAVYSEYDNKTIYHEYNSNWNDLMRVVEQIENLLVKYYVTIKGNTCLINNVLLKDENVDIYVASTDYTKMESTVEAINRFLIERKKR